jgi:undecaprenyl-diphosphatase
VSLFEAIVLGIVEGITEYLPVSSTGHLILASSLLGLDERVDKASLDAFNIIIQGGAILAVLGLYRQRVWQMVQGVLGRDATGLALAINITAAFLPAAVLGVLLASRIQQHLFFPLPVLSALALGGVAMILVDRWQRRRFHDPGEAGEGPAFVAIESLTLRGALVIGLLQCIAMWPGTSRSMVTIVGGMLVGLRPRQAAEFSFLLGLPTLGGACVYSLAKEYTREGSVNMVESLGLAAILAGVVVATLAAVVAIRWLVNFLTRHGLAPFGYYRLALCVVMGLFIWQGIVTIAPEEAPAVTPVVAPDDVR